MLIIIILQKGGKRKWGPIRKKEKKRKKLEGKEKKTKWTEAGEEG